MHFITHLNHLKSFRRLKRGGEAFCPRRRAQKKTGEPAVKPLPLTEEESFARKLFNPLPATPRRRAQKKTGEPAVKPEPFGPSFFSIFLRFFPRKKKKKICRCL
jgi:hypothetical protein